MEASEVYSSKEHQKGRRQSAPSGTVRENVDLTQMDLAISGAVLLKSVSFLNLVSELH